ncbi:MAG: multicopper oxidase domain-containing protein [Verrucomicrobia bacterium]|nr:multicopper oxidase domain-containing protein [Verrucomicrobiota bacterium]
MIFPPLPRPAVCAALALGLLGPGPATASAQPVAAPPVERTPIRPTTTVETGDRGGTFFGQKPDPARSHRYFIAAESELWDYAPAGKDEVCGLPMPPPVLANRQTGKTRYVAYTDATFGARAFGTPSLGILGPVLRGVVGEYLVVTFLNRTSEPLSMHPHGVKYDKDSEGAYYQPGPGRGAAVAPGATFTYVWFLDVMIFDESGLDEAALEAAEYAGLPGAAPAGQTWAETQQAIELGSRYAINGRLFGNLPGLEMNEGERTRWYLFALGSERDLHTAHWHGMRVSEEGRRRTDVVELLPASMKVADLLADNPGTWLYHCHVAEHMREGMFARFVVHARNTIGVDRSPAVAFLGQPAALHSVRLTRAEAQPGATPGRETVALRLEGAVTAFEGYAIFNQPFRVQLGAATAEFRPTAAGEATTPAGKLRITNATEFGVINGGVLKFELELTGPAWLAELKKLGAAAPATGNGATPREVSATVSLDVGRAHHVAAARIVVR